MNRPRFLFAPLLLCMLLPPAVLRGSGMTEGAAAPDDGADETVVTPHCPVDGKNFRARRIAATSATLPPDTAMDGFYSFLPLYACPLCGLVLPLEFYESLNDSRHSLPITDRRLANYIRSREYRELRNAAPPYFLFARILESIDPKSASDNSTQAFFLAGLYRCGAWQAKGFPVFGMDYPANPEFRKKCLEECLAKAIVGVRLVEVGEESHDQFLNFTLRGIYAGIEASRKLGDFARARWFLAAFRKYAEGYDEKKDDWRDLTHFSLGELTDAAGRQEALIDAENSEATVAPAGKRTQ